ncbi:A/G-specific adenine glycosylase [Pilimelia columellifera]|uniref:Adenine DNA glycosylase n=1 Tax=Pilimelia columellifera subsp. columellifera TaxID=706583 RepID=A0ABN3NCT4_9ACTN
MPAPADASTLAHLAIDWYDRHARDLPWRSPATTAWGVLVSEVMSQQTPVGRVAPIWLEWMERWPSPADLAAEPVAEAIRAWGRLGYPRRAMRLHACATTLVRDHEGQPPRSVPELLALPGVGAYTARAVAAFAYGQREPVVDTNVRRFVARAAAGRADAGAATTPADLAATVALLPEQPSRAARASAAFMEIGALVCTARAPVCGRCPVAARCRWRASGQALPVGPTRKVQRYAGTDRQVRGLLLAVLRDATGPVTGDQLAPVWSDDVQRDRALTSLLDDGLARQVAPGVYALAGD